MAQWVKALATKPGNLRVTPGSHTVEGKKMSHKLTSNFHGQHTHDEKNM